MTGMCVVHYITLWSRYERELKQLRSQLDERSRSVVDQRRLLELDEQRRRAEEDKMAAIRALESRSREFMREKAEKRWVAGSGRGCREAGWVGSPARASRTSSNVSIFISSSTPFVLAPLPVASCLVQLTDRALEERISVLQSQIVTGGGASVLKDSPAFRNAVKEHQERVRQEYEARLHDLEKVWWVHL